MQYYTHNLYIQTHSEIAYKFIKYKRPVYIFMPNLSIICVTFPLFFLIGIIQDDRNPTVNN